MNNVLYATARKVFYSVDRNNDKALNHTELAQATISLLSSSDGSDNNVGNLFGIFLTGGKDGLGLYPDFNGNGLIEEPEFEKFARSPKVGADDFTAAFGIRAEGGLKINLSEIQKMAGTSYAQPQESPQTPQDGTYGPVQNNSTSTNPTYNANASGKANPAYNSSETTNTTYNSGNNNANAPAQFLNDFFLSLLEMFCASFMQLFQQQQS